MAKADDFPSQRYRELVLALAERAGRVYGWKSLVARELGIAPSYVSRIDSDEPPVIGEQLIQRAVERLGVPSWFFTDASKANVPANALEIVAPGAARITIREVPAEERRAARDQAAAEVVAAAKRVVEAVRATAPASPDDLQAIADWVLERPLDHLALKVRQSTRWDPETRAAAMGLALMITEGSIE